VIERQAQATIDTGFDGVLALAVRLDVEAGGGSELGRCRARRLRR
jgi:hypothetical protein